MREGAPSSFRRGRRLQEIGDARRDGSGSSRAADRLPVLRCAIGGDILCCRCRAAREGRATHADQRRLEGDDEVFHFVKSGVGSDTPRCQGGATAFRFSNAIPVLLNGRTTTTTSGSW